MRLRWAVLAVVSATAIGGLAGWGLTRGSGDTAKLETQITRLRRHAVIARKAEHGILTRLRLAQKQLVAARADRIEPPCPAPEYGADGTAGPLFCQAADPVVLAYYRKAYPQMFKLGPDATPGQVEAVIQDHPNTLPIEYDTYTLAHALNGWSFGIQIVQGCPT